MDLQRARAILEFHQEHAWPERSVLLYGTDYYSLAVSLGTEHSPVLMTITAYADWAADVKLSASYNANTGEQKPLEAISEAHVLATLGGSLVQAHNVIAQLQQMGKAVGS